MLRPDPQPRYPPASVAWLIWGLGAGFFLLGFFHRVAPAVLHRELSLDFGLSAATLGSLSALYFYSYAAMQVPTGLLVDRLGPRRLLLGGLLVSTLGALIFAFAPDLIWAGIGRFLIGGSVSVAFVCTLKLATHWLPAHRFSMAIGLLLVAGMSGAVFAGVPLQFASGMFGWRAVTVAAAGVGLLLGLVVWLMVRDDPAERNYDSYVNVHVQSGRWSVEWQKLTAVFGYRNTCLLAIAPGGIVGSVLTFAGLWGMPFLTDVYGLSPAGAATLCSVLMLAMAFSGPLFALLSERVARRRTPYLVGTVLALGSWAVALLVPELPLWLLVSALVSAGFFSGAMILGFTQAKESVPLVLAGTVSGVVNMGVMCGPMLLQPLIGWLLDRFWRGMTGTDGLRVYHFDNYRVGFLLMLVWLAIAVVSICHTRETRCEQMGSADRLRPSPQR